MPQELMKYGALDELPQTPDDAAILLDANIGKDEHRRPGADDRWFDAIKTRAIVRITDFNQRLNEFIKANQGRNSDTVIHARLKDEIDRAQASIPWLGGNFGLNQLKNAKLSKPLTFERAIVCVLALNKLIVDDIQDNERSKTNRLAHLDTPTPEEKDAEGASEKINAISAEIDRIDAILKQLNDALLPAHSITVCCFYFFDMWPVFEIGASAVGKGSMRALIAFLAKESGQTETVIKGLIGDHPPKSTQQADLDRAVKSSASYSTMRGIFKALMTIDACRAAVDEDARTRYIQRLHVGIGNKTSFEEEVISSARRFTRPPYEWGPPAVGEEPYPL